MHFLEDVFKIIAIALVSVMNFYHINGLPLFWDHLYMLYIDLRPGRAVKIRNAPV